MLNHMPYHKLLAVSIWILAFLTFSVVFFPCAYGWRDRLKPDPLHWVKKLRKHKIPFLRQQNLAWCRQCSRWLHWMAQIEQFLEVRKVHFRQDQNAQAEGSCCKITRQIQLSVGSVPCAVSVGLLAFFFLRVRFFRILMLNDLIKWHLELEWEFQRSLERKIKGSNCVQGICAVSPFHSENA